MKSRWWIVGVGLLACTYNKGDLIRSGTQGYDGAVDQQVAGQGGWTSGPDGPVAFLDVGLGTGGRDGASDNQRGDDAQIANVPEVGTTDGLDVAARGTGGVGGVGGVTGPGGTGGGGGGMNSGGRTSEGGSGGTTANGGVTSSGGRTSTRVGTGGATGAGGSTTTSTRTGNTGTVVAFGNGKGQGAMTGYGYVDLGSADTVTSPTCGASEDEITSAKPCASGTNWSATDKLCVTGSIPALDAEKPDYDANWGISVGLNAADPDTGTLGQSFSSVTITVSGSPTSGLRAIVHLKGDGASVQYCHALTSGTAIPLTDFSLTCWDTAAPGTKVTAAQVTTIDKLAVQVNSGSTAIDVKELCITKIEFAK